MNDMLVQKTPGPLYAEPAFSDADRLLRPVKNCFPCNFSALQQKVKMFCFFKNVSWPPVNI